MYSPYYRTPRLYLSGYAPTGQPLQPHAMMDDIVGDYKDKTVTLEDFPFFANNIKMASVHPCKHAPVMKTMLDKSDANLRRRREKLRAGRAGDGVDALADDVGRLGVGGARRGAAGDAEEWEQVEQSEIDDQEVAIRVDQYLVVFLKVCATLQRARLAARRIRLLTVCGLVHRQHHAGHRARLHHEHLNS